MEVGQDEGVELSIFKVGVQPSEELSLRLMLGLVPPEDIDTGHNTSYCGMFG
jgi:hypothetical protein